MYCSPTITADEFKLIHNGLCDIRAVCDRLEGVIKPDLYAMLASAVEQVSKGLGGAYEQESSCFDKQSAHYSEVQQKLGLNSVWSMYEVQDLNQPHPYTGATRVVYGNHWGSQQVACEISGDTWAALYMAADKCIRRSGDTHHVFIEAFTQKDGSLVLHTGS